MTEADWLLLGFMAAWVTALWAVRDWSRVGDSRANLKPTPKDEQGGDA